MELTEREKALVLRGYSKEDVKRLSNFTKDELDYALEVVLYRLSRGVCKVDNPTAIFVGGQPGCGKSSEVIRLKEEYDNIIEIIFDHYRAYHPRYLEMEDVIKSHWKNRLETEDDTPGNDIADFTHEFVGSLSDELIKLASDKDKNDKGYNMIIEWGMRTSKVPLETMKTLKEKGYLIKVKFICVHKSISLKACKIRANVMNDDKHIVRNVPITFHDMCIRDLPSSINSIYDEGFSNQYIDEMILTLRNGLVIWDNSNKNVMPGYVFKKYLEDYDLTKEFENSESLALKNNNREFEVLNKKRK